MTGDPGGTVRPDPFAGAPGAEPFVFSTDAGPADFETPDVETPSEPDAPDTWLTPRLATRERRSNGLSVALIITLVVSGPVVLVELNWRGASLTNQPHYAWALAFGAAALSFLAGGVVIGWRARTSGDALGQALLLTLLVCGLLIVAAILRLLVLGKGLPDGSTILWIVLEIAVLACFAYAGALVGRLASLRSTR